MPKDTFIDYYELLEITPSANVELIETAVRAQLRRFTPQNKKTGDGEKFELVKKAYLALSNAKSRSSYDAEYKRRNTTAPKSVHRTISAEALQDEASKRVSILTVMYERMLKKPQDGALTAIEIATGVGLDVLQLEFAIWFLREKGHIARTDVGDLRITANGVEWLEGKYGVTLEVPQANAQASKSVNGAATSDQAEAPEGEHPEAVPTLLAAAESSVSQ